MPVTRYRTLLLYSMFSVLLDPDFYPYRIPDPKTATKERGEKKFVEVHSFLATSITKLKIILLLNWRRKNLGQLTKNYETFYQKKLSLGSQNMGLGSGIRKTYSESRIQGSKRNRIADLDPQRCMF
jgi:hypothetical protein